MGGVEPRRRFLTSCSWLFTLVFSLVPGNGQPTPASDLPGVKGSTETVDSALAELSGQVARLGWQVGDAYVGLRNSGDSAAGGARQSHHPDRKPAESHRRSEHGFQDGTHRGSAKSRKKCLRPGDCCSEIARGSQRSVAAGRGDPHRESPKPAASRRWRGQCLALAVCCGAFLPRLLRSLIHPSCVSVDSCSKPRLSKKTRGKDFRSQARPRAVSTARLAGRPRRRSLLGCQARLFRCAWEPGGR